MRCEKANGLGTSDFLLWTAIKYMSGKTVSGVMRTGWGIQITCCVWSDDGAGGKDVRLLRASCVVRLPLWRPDASSRDSYRLCMGARVMWWNNVPPHIQGPCTRGRNTTEFAPINCWIAQFVNNVYTLYSTHCTLYTKHWTLYSIRYTQYTIHNELYTKHYTVYTINYMLNTIHYTVCTSH